MAASCERFSCLIIENGISNYINIKPSSLSEGKAEAKIKHHFLNNN